MQQAIEAALMELVGNISQDVGELVGQVKSIQSDIAELKAHVATQNGSVARHETALAIATA